MSIATAGGWLPLFLVGIFADGWCRARMRSPWWQFPSTTLHELSHWLVALVLKARPSEFSVWPRRVEGTNEWTLGYVVFEVHWATAALVALAPLFPLGALLAAAQAQPQWALLAGWLARSLLPSRQDWSIALQNPAPLILAAVVLTW